MIGNVQIPKAQQSSSPLPEVRESEAPAHISEIYEDIKAAAALPQVNLIFRHFATKPGVLEWVWETLGPLYRSQELAESAALLTNSIPRSGPSPLIEALNENELAQCSAVLDAYNSGNPQNIIALTAFVRSMAVDGTRDPGSSMPLLTPRMTAEPDGASPFPFPALPQRDGLAPEAVKLIRLLAERHRGAPGVVPSLYLHLALWPGALGAANNFLQPIIESRDWPLLVARVIEQAEGIAEQLKPAIVPAAVNPDENVRREVVKTVAMFVNSTIPELIVVGRLLSPR